MYDKNNIFPSLEFHHGSYVWTNQEMDRVRQENCLCLNCKNMAECETAKLLYSVCIEKDMAMMITRCLKWKG